MSALPGGPADKLGNRYEAWWTLFRLADVLRGRATRLRLEPPGEAGVGVEFWIDEPERRWYEQVKNVQRPWTLKRLIDKGVLVGLVGHLRAGHHVRLVSSSAAPELASLSERSRAAETLEEYHLSILTQDERGEVRKVAAAWHAPEATAWEYLKRVKVEHHPAETLRHLVHVTYELLILGDPEVVVNELRGWLDDVLHKPLTASMIWAHLEAKGFARNALAHNPTVVAALRETVERHHRRIDAARPVIGPVTQPHVDELVERLSAVDGPQVLVVHGRAGVGKSTIASDAVRELTLAGWHAVVVRMDRAAPSLRSAAALGREFDLPRSPAVLLAGVAEDAPAVLLVDQLDAVSLYSGRMPDSFDAVAELLGQVAALRNIKVVLAVRTVDLEADPRMSALLADQTRVGTIKVGSLALDQVKTSLKRAGVDVAMLSQATLELLRIPLHLAIFSSLSAKSQSVPYRTLSDLYDRFTQELRRDLGRQVGHLDWTGITGTLVRFMSEHERLDAPGVVLDAADPNELAALTSSGVLVNDEARISMFHETYFDYLFARGFVATGGDLHDFLVHSGQHLFRRAQARQVLEYLAAIDRIAFRRTVVRLLASTSVRVHLQQVVVTVLAALDATADDWMAVEPLAFSDHKLAGQLASLLTNPNWFDAADSAGRWGPLLADPATVDLAANQLTFAARHRPDRISEIVRPYIGTNEAWRYRLRAIVGWSLTPGLVDLTVELIERGEIDDARGPIAVNSDFWSILYGIHQEDPAGAATLIGAHFNRGLVRALSEGEPDPFRSGHLDPDSSDGGGSIIQEVAAAAPSDFLVCVLPFVERLADSTATAWADGYLRSTHRWGHRYRGDRLGIAYAVFSGTEEALRLLARDDPARGTALVSTLAESDVEDLRFLACRTFTAAGLGNAGTNWLLSDDRNLELGWADSPRWASRELIEVATLTCGDAQLNSLTERLLGYYPSWERAADGRHLHGRAQYELLTAVTPSRRSAAVTRRIAEWERKFVGQPPQPPQMDGAAHFLEPPIPLAAATHMTDEHWIKAIDKYRTDATIWSGPRPIGGVRALAGLLGTRAEEEPERFARLALTFDTTIHLAHLDHVVRAVAGKIPIALMTELCLHARQIAGQYLSRTLCAAVVEIAADADDALLRLVQDCAADDDPPRDADQTRAESGRGRYGDDLLTAGLNSNRGSAARAAAQLLFSDPKRAAQLTPTVAALASDPDLGVRTWAAEAVIALMKSDEHAALEIADVLFNASLAIFDADSTCRLLRYAYLREPARFTPHLHRALAGPDSVAIRAGQVWAVAFLEDLIVPPSPTIPGDLPPAARRGAAMLFATAPEVARQQLTELFDDASTTVQEAAAAAMRSVNELTPEAAHTFVIAFTNSIAFEKHFNQLFIALNGSPQLLPLGTVEACERAIALAFRDLGDLRTARAATGRHISSVILRLYRQGDEPTRARCLDLIDKLTHAGAIGLGEALSDQR
ncbi:NB-ARC domain-containing protein [Spirillospora sp. NPDC047279]|uniref:NB-ARC domain-containing protein n=1 Tax=Spirillospora sp. NPDC047279 TaxID=3155478 RepID=UPI0033E3229A